MSYLKLWYRYFIIIFSVKRNTHWCVLCLHKLVPAQTETNVNFSTERQRRENEHSPEILNHSGKYSYDAQCTKRAFMHFGVKLRSACTFTEAEQGLCCPLTKSMDTVVYVDIQRRLRSDCMDAHACFVCCFYRTCL